MDRPFAEAIAQDTSDRPKRCNPGDHVKSMVRVMGLADGSFTWKDPDTVVVGVVVRLPGYVEAIHSTVVQVDGDDATASVIAMVEQSGYGGQLAALMVKGASVAGFNVLDGSAIHQATGVPLITVSREEPDMQAIKTALTSHFDDWQRRLALLEQGPPRKVRNGEFHLYCQGYGIEHPKLAVVVRKATIQGAIPEPIRLAHLMARTMVPKAKNEIAPRTGADSG